MCHNSKNQNPEDFFSAPSRLEISGSHDPGLRPLTSSQSFSLHNVLPGVELLSTGFGASLDLNPA